jgi:hypothetical protein
VRAFARAYPIPANDGISQDSGCQAKEAAVQHDHGHKRSREHWIGLTIPSGLI